MNSLVRIHQTQATIRDNIKTAWTIAVVSDLDLCISTFSPNIVKDPLKWLKIILDVISLGFAVAVAPIWNVGEFATHFPDLFTVQICSHQVVVLKNSPKFSGPDGANNLGWIKDTTNSIVTGGEFSTRRPSHLRKY